MENSGWCAKRTLESGGKYANDAESFIEWSIMPFWRCLLMKLYMLLVGYSMVTRGYLSINVVWMLFVERYDIIIDEVFVLYCTLDIQHPILVFFALFSKQTI